MKLPSLLFFLTLSSSNLVAATSEVDQFLEERLCQAPVLSTHTLSIPGYPDAYNPSLLAYQDGYLLSFRYTSRLPDLIRQTRTDASFIGLARLDAQCRVIPESVQLLSIQSYSSKYSLSAEDARLLRFQNEIYLFFNDRPSTESSGFAMYFAKIREEKGGFTLQEPAKPLRYPFAVSVEKNWSPFTTDDKLYVIYADHPRTILEVDPHTGNCHEITKAPFPASWDLGEIRGGTQAYRVGPFFLTFFHSCFPASTPKNRAYVMGAYLFDPTPPFTVRSLIPLPLGTVPDYTQKNPQKVVFPCGLVVQEDKLLVTWGKSDNQMQLTVFDRNQLLQCMQPVP